jgi:hypothetical protein
VAVLGPGEALSDEGKKAVRLSPPWWLIAITVLGLMSLCGSVGRHLSEITEKMQEAPNELQRERAAKEQSEQNMRDEIAAWKNFKERYNIR